MTNTGLTNPALQPVQDAELAARASWEAVRLTEGLLLAVDKADVAERLAVKLLNVGPFWAAEELATELVREERENVSERLRDTEPYVSRWNKRKTVIQAALAAAVNVSL